MSSSNPRPLTPPPGHNDNPRLPIVLLGSIFLILLAIGIIGSAWFMQLRKKQAPAAPPVLGQVSAPTFTDQNGTSFSLTQLDGRIWVADSIFTRCGGQCPVMSYNMMELQDWLVQNEQGGVKLVSLTVDPENDTPAILTEYAGKFKADLRRWHFLTGDRNTLYNYIMNDFKLGAEENQGVPDAEMFIHSDKFVLIDRDRNIRGYFSGTDEADMEKLRTAIIALSNEDTPPPDARRLNESDNTTTPTAASQ